MPRIASTKTVTYGNATASYRPRNDGRWVVYWREAGQGVQTTALNESQAKAKALEEARRISSAQGGRLLTIEDAQIVEAVKKLAGNRPAFAWLREIEDCQTRLHGVTIPTAVDHYVDAGYLSVKRELFSVAKDAYLKTYKAPGKKSKSPGKESRFSIFGPRQELAAFDAAHTGAMVTEITKATLQEWVARPLKKDKGEASPNTFNNRLKTWKAFLNWCQHDEQKLLPPSEAHAAASIDRLPVRSSPKIWTPEVAQAIYALLPDKLRPYLIIGCWLGLRPTEILRVKWELFDWKRGYLHVDDTVAEKTPDQRFIPMSPLVKALLAPWKDAKGKCCRWADQGRISKLARDAKLITKWEIDVMRHSYISYQIANGVSKAQIAEWSGNSEVIIKRHYRRPLRKEDGKAWFQYPLPMAA